MTTLEAILLGAMLAWTPSVVVLAALLRDIRDLEETEEFGRDPGVREFVRCGQQPQQRHVDQGRFQIH